jgi:hypothetical protein
VHSCYSGYWQTIRWHSHIAESWKNLLKKGALSKCKFAVAHLVIRRVAAKVSGALRKMPHFEKSALFLPQKFDDSIELATLEKASPRGGRFLIPKQWF